MERSIALIPARGGSKRLPGKNLLELGSIPLIAHSIKYAQAHPDLIDAVYVTTDDQEIARTAVAFGAKVIDRPAALSGDLEPTVSALRHALSVLPETVETVTLLQPTNPLRPEGLLREAFSTLQDRACESLFTVSRSWEKLGRIQNGRFFPFNYAVGQRSQDLEPLYFENGLLYLSSAALIRNNKILSEDAFPLPVSHIFAQVDIDTQDDLDYARYLITRK